MEEARGTCRVMCFHPKSNVTVPRMTLGELEEVVGEWIRQAEELGKKWGRRPDGTFSLTSVTNLRKKLRHLCGILTTCSVTSLKLNLLSL